MSPQELLARLLIDPPLAEEMRSAPEEFARRHGIDSEAARQLAALPLPGFDVTVRITTHKRKNHLISLFPGSFALVDGTPEESELVSVALSRPTLNSRRDALAIGRALGSVAAAMPDNERTALLRDVIAFETLCYEAEALAGGPEPPPGPPMLRPGVLLATFDRPMAEVLRLVIDGRASGELPEGTTSYLVRATAGSSRVRTHRLPARLADLLAACDGIRSAPAVAHLAGLPLETTERGLHAMVAKGFVSWRPDHAGPRHGPV